MSTLLRRLPVIIAIFAAIAILAATAAGCAPSAPPDHFGNCPVSQHWKNPSGQPTGWECVR